MSLLPPGAWEKHHRHDAEGQKRLSHELHVSSNLSSSQPSHYTLRFLVYGEREERECVCVCVCACLSQGAKQQLEHERQLKREAFHQVDDLLTQVHSGYCLVMKADLIS